MATDSATAESSTERVNEQAKKAAERAQSSVEKQARSLRTELGRVVFDFAENQFPEEARSRKRDNVATAFGVGLAVGFLARHVIDR